MPELNYSRGVYPATDAARITHLAARRIYRWVCGYDFKGQDGSPRSSRPVFEREHSGPNVALTFADLVEVVYVKHFIDSGIGMRRVKAFHEEARAEFGVRHPFALKRFETDGKTVLRRFFHGGKERMEDRKNFQMVERIVFDPLVKRLTFDQATLCASEYWPMGREVPVVLNPNLSFGEPVVATHRVPTRVLARAVSGAGESKARVARLYRVDVDEVDAALKYEASLKAA